MLSKKFLILFLALIFACGLTLVSIRKPNLQEMPASEKSIAVIQEKTLGKETLTPAIAQIEDWIDRLPNTERTEKLKQVLNSSSQGKMILRMFLVSNYFNYSKEADSILEPLQNAYQIKFAEDPESAKLAIENGLNELPAETFGLERGALIGTLSTLPGKTLEARERALEEFMKSIPPPRFSSSTPMTEEQKNLAYSTNEPYYQLPILAHHYFLETSPDFDEALRGTLNGLAVQKDQGVRSALVEQLIRQFPDRKNEITASL